MELVYCWRPEPFECAGTAMTDGTVSQDVVRSRLAELLVQADLNTVSERMLVAILCSDVGEAVKTEYRQLIKVLIKHVVLPLQYTVLLSRTGVYAQPMYLLWLC